MTHNRVNSTQATAWLKKNDSQTTICKILLPKFNTWKPVRLEREKGSLLPLDNAVGGFSASFFCDSSQMALPLHRNRIAVSP